MNKGKTMAQHKFDPAIYTGDLSDTLAVLKHYAEQDTTLFEHKSGRRFAFELGFKPEHQYLTREGYPLGTTCWYVRIEWGWSKFFCADTISDAVRLAHEFVMSRHGMIISDVLDNEYGETKPLQSVPKRTGVSNDNEI